MAKKKQPPAGGPPCVLLTQLDRDELDENAPPRVRDILLAAAALTADEQRNLSSRLHRFIHPDYAVVMTANAAELEQALWRMTDLARELSGKLPRNPKRNDARDAKIIELAADGRKADWIRWLFMRDDQYKDWRMMENGKPLSRAAVQRVITDHAKGRHRGE